MKKVLSVLFALAFVLSSCVVFAEGSNKEAVVLLPTMGNEWSCSVDNPDILEQTSFCQNVKMPQGQMNEWRFVGLKEGDATITFTCPEYKQKDGTTFMSRTCTYTYHVDKDLNVVCVYMDEWGSETEDFATVRRSHTGQVVWSDDDNEDGTRPDSIEIVCYSDYNKVPVRKLVTSECKNEEGNWLFSLSEFPDYREDSWVNLNTDVMSVPEGYSRFILFGHTVLLYKEDVFKN